MWKRLIHPNVLPLLGVTIDSFQLISSWMSGGHLLGYIQNNSDADRLALVGTPPPPPPPHFPRTYSRYQLLDVAKGLCYLHSCNVVHGDLKGVRSCSKYYSTTMFTYHQLNVLVNDSGHACIADFGLATVAKTLDSIESATCQRGHSARWAAPEVLGEGTHSKEADVFSFAMVMIEVCHRRSTMHRALAYRHFISIQVFTGMIPFSNDTSAMAMLATIQGKRPPRPTHPTLTKDMWALMQRCWDHDPHLRPEVSEALQDLTLSVFLSAPAITHSSA
jgi:serine/threonine protein kinase